MGVWDPRACMRLQARGGLPAAMLPRRAHCSACTNLARPHITQPPADQLYQHGVARPQGAGSCWQEQRGPSIESAGLGPTAPRALHLTLYRTKHAPHRRPLHAPHLSAQAGTVWVNCYNVYEAAVPFGGYKSSGEQVPKSGRRLNALPPSVQLACLPRGALSSQLPGGSPSTCPARPRTLNRHRPRQGGV